ncbi:hypothetical protein PAXRUDRAFT_764544 [Paxillus rubicundulus Ve08.2h10]|uniref:Uncharacterized protein n=1 Tax=Paxillus rubicundulus Ve08.2h10 TaxID=930991 RepID=A0A0D0DH81_9AGAM|nr:hypothetical protein PAXRUDRAFT_764544 [Paxillus rubicundulus Ve08.2h10]
MLTSLDDNQGYSGMFYLKTLIILLLPVKVIEREHIVNVYHAILVDVPQGQKQVTPVHVNHWGSDLDLNPEDLEVEETSKVLDHDLTIKASHIAEPDSSSLPTGQYTSVVEADNSSGAHIHDNKRIGDLLPGTRYGAFSSPHRIPVSESPDALDLVNAIPTVLNDPIVKLSSDKSGRAVEFDTKQAGPMRYTNNRADTGGYREKIHGGTGLQGDGYVDHSAAFIEFHEPLSAFFVPTSTSTDTLLTSDEVYDYFVCADIVSRPRE